MPPDLQYFDADELLTGTSGTAEEVVGDLHLTLSLGRNSFATLSDNDPTSWTDFIGILGGAWGESAGTLGLANFSAEYINWRYVTLGMNAICKPPRGGQPTTSPYASFPTSSPVRTSRHGLGGLIYCHARQQA